MPYYYQTGTAAHAADLKTIIINFCVNTLGWTSIYTNPVEKIDNNGNESYHKNTTYLSVNGRYFFITTGINGASVDYRNYLQGGCIDNPVTPTGVDPYYAYDDQPGYGYTAYTNDIAGPYTKYHLFGGQEGVDGHYVYCVIETTVGLFTHFGLGQPDRVGTLSSSFAVGVAWNMGTSYWRSVSSNYHQRMFDSWNSTSSSGRGHLKIAQGNADHYIFGYNNDHVYGGTPAGLNSYLVDDGPNAFNGRTMLQPNHIYVHDRGSPAWYRIIGLAPAYRTLRMDNLQPEDIVDTDWMVFPLRAKNAAAGPTSGNYGIAYKFQ